jgi:hypothetical protein
LTEIRTSADAGNAAVVSVERERAQVNHINTLRGAKETISLPIFLALVASTDSLSPVALNISVRLV